MPQPRSRASFGPILQRERLKRNVSLEDVARDTRLARRYLVALESQSIDNLPGGLYNRAYVRTYAEYLGLDADSLVRDYDLEAQAQFDAGRLAAQPDTVTAMNAVIQRRGPQTTGGKIALWNTARVVALSAVLVMLVGAMWLGARHVTHSAEPLPVLVSGPPVLMLNAGATEPVEVSAKTAPVTAPLTELEPPRPDPEPVAPAQGVTAEIAPSEIAPADHSQAATSLSVNSSGVGTDVVDRQLVGRADTFAVGTRAVFWTLVTGGRPGDTIRHVWVYEGRTVGTFKLPIGSASWRTQSRRLLAPGAEGAWVVEAHDAGGRVLARHTFRCEPQ